MPIPEGAARQQLHARSIDYRGYERNDGMWDIEAHMKDRRAIA